MNEFVSVDKMSKKQKAAYFKQRRNTWGINPITRKKESKKRGDMCNETKFRQEIND